MLFCSNVAENGAITGIIKHLYFTFISNSNNNMHSFSDQTNAILDQEKYLFLLEAYYSDSKLLKGHVCLYLLSKSSLKGTVCNFRR